MRAWVYVEQADGEAGTFPIEDVKGLLNRKDPAKAIREYYDENF
jgi:hypothetical protein